MLPKRLLLLCLLVYGYMGKAQKQWSNWYFNGYAMMSFNAPGNAGQFLTNYNTPVPPGFTNYAHSSNPGTAYSDPVTGQMKFLVAGRLAFDRMYNLVNSSNSIRMCTGDNYSIHIIPFANNPNKFYVIQFQSRSADMLAASSGLQVRCPGAIGLGYSVFDLSLNGGLGNFESMNNIVMSGLPERISVIKHANGKDAWVVVHGWGNNTYYSYLFTDAGVQTAVTTSIGPVITGIWSDAIGHMVPSHNGKTIAAQQYGKSTIELYDFNNSTGLLSSYRTLNSQKPIDRMLFSPDDSKLYYLGNYEGPGLFQFDFNKPNIQGSLVKIGDDPSKTYWQMQLGLDGKIYVASVQGSNTDHFSIVHCPNLPKYACNFERKGMEAIGYGQFPNFVNNYIQQPAAPPITEFSLGVDTAICFGNFTLSAPLGWASYKWNTGETTRQIVISAPGTYYVLAGETGFSCPTAFGSIKIANAAKPLYLGKDTTLCPQVPYTITVPANFSNILWNDGTTDQVKTVLNGGRYSVIATDENGCTNWDTIQIGRKFYPQASFGQDTTLCNNQTLLLRLQPQANFLATATYLWQNGSIKDTFRVTQAGFYWGRVTFEGCTVSDSINVNYVNAQSVSLGKDTTLCDGDSLRLQVNIPGSSVLWSTGEILPSIVVKNSGNYWVKVNNGVCTVSDTIQVSFSPKPAVFLGNDTLLCERQTLTLTAETTGATYLWQNGTTQSNIVVSSPGVYWVQVTKGGCSVKDSIVIGYKPLPVLNLGKDTGICINTTLLLNAYHSQIASYLWQDQSTAPDFLIQSSGLYNISVTGLNGCVSKDTIQVTTTPLPSFSLGNDTSLCQGQKLLVAVPPLNNAFYQWNTGSSMNNLEVSDPGIYWVDVTQNGCRKRDSIMVSFKPNPIVDLGNDTTLCEDATKLLIATNSDATYLWQDQTTQPTYAVTKPGVYGVKVKVNGCISGDTIKIGYRFKPSFFLGRDTVLCLGSQIRLLPTVQNAGLLWQDGSTASSYTVSSPGVYRLTAQNECGSFTDEIKIIKTLCKLLMPTAFTPNNDGKNDVFRVKYPAFIKQFKMSIYNRWGETIFTSTNPSAGWDGKYKGIDQPTGNYVWYITLIDLDGYSETGKGNVMIIR